MRPAESRIAHRFLHMTSDGAGGGDEADLAAASDRHLHGLENRQLVA
ncbi:hypothetical protein [Rhizobium leguminosarum]